MDTRDIDNEAAELIILLINLQRENKLDSEFSNYVQVIIQIKDDCVNKKKEKVPIKYEVIKALAMNDILVLKEYLNQLVVERKEALTREDERAKTTYELVDSSLKTEHEECESDLSLDRNNDVITCRQTSAFVRAKNIAFSCIDGGFCSDIAGKQECKDIVLSYLIRQENGMSSENLQTKTTRRILLLCNNGAWDGLVQLIRQMLTQGMETQGEIPVNPDLSKSSHISEVTKVINIVTGSVKNLKDIDEPVACFIEVVAFLSMQELHLNPSPNTESGEYVLSSTHQDILNLDNKGLSNVLHLYMQNLIGQAKEEKAVEKVNTFLKERAKKLHKNTLIHEDSILASLGITLTIGLSALHIHTSAVNGVNFLIENIDLALSDPELNSNTNTGAVSGVLVAGVCIWNAYYVSRCKKFCHGFEKDMTQDIVAMAISNGVGYGALVTTMSIRPPALLSLLIYGGVGFGAHLLVTSSLKRFNYWYLHKAPIDQATTKAYIALNSECTESDEQLLLAYRQKCQQYHSDIDILKPVASQKVVREATRRLLEVQRAFLFISQMRLREIGETSDDEKKFSRIEYFISSAFKRNDE